MAELSKAYEPQAVEAKWYARWLSDGVFHADPSSAKPAYSIVIPPPNVTGVLTLGHVLNNTIQDILARRARMTGHEVLWLPGLDHAGIATQSVVEKRLRKEEGKTRHDLGREEFVRRIWEWKEKHGGIIIEQLKRLGCSCDWARERFTMDAAYSRAVQQVFVDLYEKGLIYRGRRMVNWDPVALTALSDEEVIPTPQKSALYYVRYELVDEPGRFLEVATTRPETIMADVALAVQPNDERYRALLGKKVWRPLDRAELPIIGDDAIDPAFGTGVLKVTPAHDKVDFEIGQRHDLPVIDVLHPNGKINCPAVPELDGLDRFAARKKSVELLSERGLLAKEEPHESKVGFSERAGVPIEPRLSEQWFLNTRKSPRRARPWARGNAIRFRPERWENVYQHWLENIQDWCISRQLWWGHRIPVWYRGDEVRCQIESPGDGWTQDPDVLDTWFSSWLWPFETMDAETRAKFYPTNDLVTAPDIIFFWVARMIMAGLEWTGEVPVSRCLFHRAHPRRFRAQNEQVVRQLARPARPDREIRRGRRALRPDADRADRAGHPFRRKADRGRPQLREQALERDPLPADARRRNRGRDQSRAAHQRRQVDPAPARSRDPRGHSRAARITTSAKRRRRSIAFSGASIATGIWRRAKPRSASPAKARSHRGKRTRSR